jgi:hypothetical protein
LFLKTFAKLIFFSGSGSADNVYKGWPEQGINAAYDPVTEMTKGCCEPAAA